jgi:hypothetical protein
MMIDCYTRYITVGMSIDKMWQLGITSKAMMGVGGSEGMAWYTCHNNQLFLSREIIVVYHTTKKPWKLFDKLSQ